MQGNVVYVCTCVGAYMYVIQWNAKQCNARKCMYVCMQSNVINVM